MNDKSNCDSITCRNELGEGVVWDEVEMRFIWTDIQRSQLWQAGATGEATVKVLPHRLASFALSDRPGVIVAAFDVGIAAYDLKTEAVQWIARPDLPNGVRFNDGRTDRAGRFVVGTMVEDATAARGLSVGTLYRLEWDGSLSTLIEGIAISNALCFSPDGERMYHADTPTGELCSYAYSDAGVSDRCVIRRYEGLDGPDGACVDANGNIWIAIWGGSRVECVTPHGELLQRIDVPASQPTCPAFGGPDLNILAVTSAWQDLAEAPEHAPQSAGDFHRFPLKVRGLPECRVRFRFPI